MSTAYRTLPAIAPARATAGPGSEPGLALQCAVFAALVLIWALYFTVTEAPVALKHDMTEAFAWGQEFQLGYYQHPPFWAWVCGLWFAIFPCQDWAFALLSSLNAAIGLWGAWMVIGDFASGRTRMAAWVLLLLTPLYTFYAYKYNANIIFISIWPWALHYQMRSLRSRGRRDAVALGICIGLALMSKYYALILVATCFAAALQHPMRRQYFRSSAPYLAAAVTIAVCTPHVWWLLTHGAPPVHYLEDVSGRRWHQVIASAADTVVECVAMNLGVLAVIGWTMWRSNQGPAALGQARGSNLGMLATLVLLPAGLSVTSALALRTTITPEMTVGIFPLLPLLVIEAAGVTDIDRLWRVGSRLAVIITLGALALSPAIMVVRTFYSPAATKVIPYREVVAAATRLWHAQTRRKLAYVTGNPSYENAAAFYSPDHPHAFAYFDYGRNLWVTPEDLARDGLLSICVDADEQCRANTTKFATPQTTRTVVSLTHEFLGHVTRPMRFAITIIPPAASGAHTSARAISERY